MSLSESDEFNIADNSLREFEPLAAWRGLATAWATSVSSMRCRANLGTLMAGAGSPGSGPPGGELGEAVFFGTRSKGDRFVFVVDNSSSMKDGRFEAAIAELVRSVEALSPRQAFYVIFVSDQTYPMFYPQPATDLLPATAPNKKRLAEWLPKAILASGKNRELIKAMDMAASLRPACRVSVVGRRHALQRKSAHGSHDASHAPQPVEVSRSTRSAWASRRSTPSTISRPSPRPTAARIDGSTCRPSRGR